MADTPHIPDETRAYLVIASEVWQSRVACARSGLPHRYAPRNDVDLISSAPPRLRMNPSFFVSREAAKSRRGFANITTCNHLMRHAELVSASISPFKPMALVGGWTLKQVQGDSISIEQRV